MTNMQLLLMLVCVSCAIALTVAEARQSALAKALFKCAASTSFVILAIVYGAPTSEYGRLVLAALVLSWVGDMLLLSKRSHFFLAGIAAFLLAHVAFAVSFASHSIDNAWLAIAAIVMTLFGIVTLRWLWRHLAGFYKIAVPLYVAAIALMCSFAISTSAASGVVSYALGALVFAASDISVARDRFVKPGVMNRAWGLPLYYAAQLILAWTIAQGAPLVS